jgi:predicted ATPase
MLGSTRHDFRATELAPDLLATPFRVQTNWHVITGAPSSGKTTLIDQLAEEGFRTVSEGARQYLEREATRGRTVEKIREDEATERGIAEMQLRIEGGLRANEVVFPDRAFPDCLAYRRVFVPNPNEILADCFHHRYASVFLLDRFPVEQDGIRFHDEATADLIARWLARDYSALGYRVVRVPVLSPQERLAFVLERLSEQGWIS